PGGREDDLALGGGEQRLDGVPGEIEGVHAVGKAQEVGGAGLIQVGRVVGLALEALPRFLAGRDEAVGAAAADQTPGTPGVTAQEALLGPVEPALVAGAGLVAAAHGEPARTAVALELRADACGGGGLDFPDGAGIELLALEGFRPPSVQVGHALNVAWPPAD